MTEQQGTDVLVMPSSAEGVLLGAAVGDALGWPQEYRGQIVGGQKARDELTPQPRFIAWERSAGHYTNRRRDRVGAGEYSDDTQLLLATARACLHGESWLSWLTEIELPVWPLYQRGGGGAVLTACSAWAAGRAPWEGQDAKARKTQDRYVGAGANGVAMRIAPHVLAEPDLGTALRRVLQDGVQTHGHPRALVGALVYAAALHVALRQSDTMNYGQLLDAAEAGLLSVQTAQSAFPSSWPDDIRDRTTAAWEPVIAEVRALLGLCRASLQQGAMSHPEKLLVELGCDNPKVNGAGTITAVAAVYLASRFAARPMGGLLQAAFLRRGDTDTLASMTGALLGALHGTGWLEGLDLKVQDAAYLATIASRLVHPQPRQGDVSQTPQPVSILRDEMLRELEHVDPYSETRPTGRFPDGRTWQLVRLDAHEEFNPRAFLALEDGQTVFIELPKKKRPASSKPTEQLSIDDQVQPQGPPSDAPLRSGISLPTGDLKRAAAFYAALLGRPVTVIRDAVRVTDWLTLRPGPTDHQATESVLRFEVPDLTAAAKALGQTAADRVLRGHDPDGRRIEIYPRAMRDNGGSEAIRA